MKQETILKALQVKFGSHKRYQEWFQRQYLLTPESQSLRCDLIRFIVGVIHPTNELLCSDIIPRWAVIGWLLTTCLGQVAASNAKLALFYDWLFFEPEKDNIMNIEPAILVMHHSIKPHPAITTTLLDFLCRIIPNFYPKQQDKVRNGIYSSLRQILEKRVLPSLSPLFDNPKLDKELKLLLRERFSPFVTEASKIETAPDEVHIEDRDVDSLEDFCGTAEFSDDDSAVELLKNNETSETKKANKENITKKKSSPPNPASSSSSNSKKETRERPSPVKVRKRPEKTKQISNDKHEEDLGEAVSQLLTELKSSNIKRDADHLLLRSDDQDEEEKCEIMDQLIRLIISEDLNFEQCNALAGKLSEILRSSFVGRIFPGAMADEESLEDSVGKPLFVAFRSLCDMADSEGSGILLQVLAELYAIQPRVGYYLLYFLSVDKQAKGRDSRTKAAIYKDLCETIDSNYCLDICLVNDMRQCQEDDVELFVHLVPDIYTIFPKTAVGNVNLLYLVVSCVDGRQIQQLVCHILQKNLFLFKKDSFASIVTGSLSWETFEQCALWQLIGAHDVPIDCMYSIIPKLDFHKHAEGLTATLLRLRTEKPNADLVRHILNREHARGDRFVTTALSHWLFEHQDKLAELVANYLQKQLINSNSNQRDQSLKRKRGTRENTSSSLSKKAEMTLTHLDNLRQNSVQYEFFSHPSLQKALKSSRQACSDDQKKKFMDLFALAETESAEEDDDDDEVTLNPRVRKSKKANNSRGRNQADSGDSSESENSDDDLPLSSSRSGSSAGKNSRKASSKSNSRKRPQSKNSYKGESSENSSEDELTAKKKKRRKKAAHSDSD